MKTPRRMFRKRKADHDVIVTTTGRGPNFILGDPDASDLPGYNVAIRSEWWRAYRGGVENPIVVAVHKRSRLASERGLTEGEGFTFLAVPVAETYRAGWPVNPAKSNRPPTMIVLLATGTEVQGHFVCDMTPAGVIDAAHFDEEVRENVLRGVSEEVRPALISQFERPWLYR